MLTLALGASSTAIWFASAETIAMESRLASTNFPTLTPVTFLTPPARQSAQLKTPGDAIAEAHRPVPGSTIATSCWPSPLKSPLTREFHARFHHGGAGGDELASPRPARRRLAGETGFTSFKSRHGSDHVHVADGGTPPVVQFNFGADKCADLSDPARGASLNERRIQFEKIPYASYHDSSMTNHEARFGGILRLYGAVGRNACAARTSVWWALAESAHGRWKPSRVRASGN